MVFVNEKGSGIRISRTEIITHKGNLDSTFLLGSTSTVKVSVKGEGVVVAKLQGYDDISSVVLLTFIAQQPGGTWVEVPTNFVPTWTASGTIRGVFLVGGPVAMVGYAKGISTVYPIVTGGHVVARWISSEGSRYGHTDAAYLQGMRGGAVFNQYEELAGMILSSDKRASELTGFTTSKQINTILPDLRDGKKGTLPQ